eukprot:CAMPEP_0117670650 /NCGR_PEP_ID=MMETSP0804-20121206/12887_1 /TAXON_ID=1074897 /ORGANISM="Tetraselmis astigmatica, Strain CCMP880" /LENGTH=174 /DNA_ID=CAMNT_0005479005 /DNA_START=389 /DNA_END=912 /DNA_ORIENTATION=-
MLVARAGACPASGFAGESTVSEFASLFGVTDSRRPPGAPTEVLRTALHHAAQEVGDRNSQTPCDPMTMGRLSSTTFVSLMNGTTEAVLLGVGGQRGDVAAASTSLIVPLGQLPLLEYPQANCSGDRAEPLQQTMLSHNFKQRPRIREQCLQPLQLNLLTLCAKVYERLSYNALP